MSYKTIDSVDGRTIMSRKQIDDLILKLAVTPLDPCPVYVVPDFLVEDFRANFPGVTIVPLSETYLTK